MIRSGATGRVIRVPDDVAFDALLAARCNQRAGRSDDPLLRVRHVVRRGDRADAARRRLRDPRQLAHRRCRGCSARPHSSSTQRAAGFTLIEVLVALAVVAVSLAAIGSLDRRDDARRALDRRAPDAGRNRARDRHRAARTATSSRPATSPARPRAIAGASTCCRSTPTSSTRGRPTGCPQTVVVRVQSPSGPILQINTVRLRRRPAE